jgi:hypothetical protein
MASWDGTRKIPELLVEDPELAPYWEKMTIQERSILKGEEPYVGIAPKKAKEIAAAWRKRLGL